MNELVKQGKREVIEVSNLTGTHVFHINFILRSQFKHLFSYVNSIYMDVSTFANVKCKHNTVNVS